MIFTVYVIKRRCFRISLFKKKTRFEKRQLAFSFKVISKGNLILKFDTHEVHSYSDNGYLGVHLYEFIVENLNYTILNENEFDL